ncbi:MAG: hypothetical protein MMC23_003443 [Stictis urceolatum]|nr:hypothetical protein [Stictis urceolata]
MPPQWHSPRYEGTAASESVYSQPSPPRSSAWQSFPNLFASSFAWPSRQPASAALSTPAPKSPTTAITATSPVPLRLPPLGIGGQALPDNESSPISRSPTSVRSMIDPAISPVASNGGPLSPLTMISSVRSSPIQAPARVLDYGGNVPLGSTFSTSGRRFGSRHHVRHVSRRRQRSPGPTSSGRSARAVASAESVRSYEERSRDAMDANAGRRRRVPRWVPKHAKGKAWFPAMRYSAVRVKVFHAVVSGSLLMLILIVFLALLSSNSEFTQEFRIIAILFMLVFTVLFAHSLIRLFMLMLQLKKRGTLDRHPSLNSGNGYARPTQPIRVVLARDEEIGIGGTPPIGLDEPKPIPPPPPAYGLWRGSVRVDPDLIHWQRVEQSQGTRPLSAGTIRRPPSYPEGGDSSEHQIERQMFQEQGSAPEEQEMATRWLPSPPAPP